MNARAAVVVFPGSNCELDCMRSLSLTGLEPVRVWHQEKSLPDADVVVLPGGFAHGDYLRTGAIARFSPVMEAVQEHSESGGLVLGICNGFQILCEAGMLPGAFRKNSGLKFLCRWTDVRVDNPDTPFTRSVPADRVLRIPINHFEGNWYCRPGEIERLKANDQIVFRYVENPNGSLDDVAGVMNEQGNVLGLMPHPERACEPILGSEDGATIFRSMLESVISRGAVTE